MTEEKKRFRFADLVADTVRAHHGAFAYMYVLEQLEGTQKKVSAAAHDRQLWLDVLDELDNIERKEDATPRVQTSTEDNK
jgi:hypothetical protein